MGCGFGDVLNPINYLTGANAAGKQIDKAQNAQTQMTLAGQGTQMKMFNKGLELMKPYTTLGAGSLSPLALMAGLTPVVGADGNTTYNYTGMEASPLYQFQRNEMMRDMPRLLGGRSDSTYGQREMQRALSGLSANEAARQENSLLNLANMGRGAATTTNAGYNNLGQNLSALYGNYANNMGNLYGQQGQLYTSYSPFNVVTSAAKAAAPFMA